MGWMVKATQMVFCFGTIRSNILIEFRSREVGSSSSPSFELWASGFGQGDGKTKLSRFECELSVESPE